MVQIHAHPPNIMKFITKEELLLDLKKYSLDTNEEILKALSVAYNVHNDQLRDSGNSYLEEHIYPLTLQTLLRHKNHPELTHILVVCILHDIVEDGDIEPGYINEMFSKAIEDYVLALTKDRVTLTQRPTQEWLYDQTKKAIEKVKIAGEIPQIIRIEDRLQNLETANFTNINKKEKYLRMLDETKDLYIPLSKNLDPQYGYENLLMDEINRINNILNLN